MTVTYTAKIATVKFKTLWKLLRRWRGSVYKHLWKDALLFITLYYTISLVYRLTLTPNQKQYFEKLVLYCRREANNIPVAFVLGFYVTIVVNRWWQQVNDHMPWPDNLAIVITALVHGNDDRGRLMRRTLMRYINLSWIISLCSISTVAKKRFPTLDHLVEIGLMTKNEQEIFDNIKTGSNKYYIPLVWATTLISRARKEDRIHTDYGKVQLLELVAQFRTGLGTLFNYDWLSVPLTYTQVVTIAVQAYFLANVIGAQFLEANEAYPDRDIDVYIPVFTLLQFLFYMGWLKVAESLINPFGEDDDDFDTNWVIDRNIQVSYLIVDDMHSEHPELIKDAYWDSMDFELPYTAAAEQFKMEPYLGSTNEIEFKEEELVFLPTVIEEEEAGRKTSGENQNSADSSNHNIVRISLQKLLQGIKRTTNKSLGDIETKQPTEATRDAEVQSQQSVVSETSAAMISNTFDNYLTVREYPASTSNQYNDKTKQSAIYFKTSGGRRDVSDAGAMEARGQQRRDSYFHDSRESPTMNFPQPSPVSTAAGTTHEGQQRRKSDKPLTLNQTNNASKGGQLNKEMKNTGVSSSATGYETNERQQIFGELREWKAKQDQRLSRQDDTVQSNEPALLTERNKTQEVSRSIVRNPARLEENGHTTSQASHGILRTTKHNMVRRHSSSRGSRQVALHTNLPTYRSDKAHGQSQGQRRSSQSVSQWYGHLVSHVLHRDNAQGTTTTRQRANSDHSARGTTRSPTHQRSSWTSTRMTDNEKLDYLEREIAEAEQLLEEINRVEREMQHSNIVRNRQRGGYRTADVV